MTNDNDQFTCSNSRFETDVGRGYPHGTNKAKGSVFPSQIAGEDGGFTLWLEHVRDKKNNGGADIYWLMWYDGRGKPTIPLSGILTSDDIQEIGARFIKMVGVE